MQRASKSSISLFAADGYGWAQFEFGEQIGKDNRYTIVRKLSWGMHSSTWLTRDNMSVHRLDGELRRSDTTPINSDNKFVAVKAVTSHYTDMYERVSLWEAEALRLASQPPSSPHCAQLLDELTNPGKCSAGSHMCFVMPVCGSYIEAVVHAQSTALPFSLAKRIILHLIHGIAYVHERGIVHTDLKHDNIFFSTTMSTEDIGAWGRRNPRGDTPRRPLMTV